MNVLSKFEIKQSSIIIIVIDRFDWFAIKYSIYFKLVILRIESIFTYLLTILNNSAILIIQINSNLTGVIYSINYHALYQNLDSLKTIFMILEVYGQFDFFLR